MKLWGKSKGVQAWAGAVLAMSALGFVGCASDLAYDAPFGSIIEVGPSEFTATVGSVIRLQAWVKDETLYPINNIRLTVASSYPGILLVPQTAIKAYSDDDTTWQVGSEHYYELTEVDNQIDSSYLETVTDDSGMADVFVYMRCVPAKCDSIYTDTCNLGVCGGEAAELESFDITFYTAAISYTITSTSSQGG